MKDVKAIAHNLKANHHKTKETIKDKQEKAITKGKQDVWQTQRVMKKRKVRK